MSQNPIDVLREQSADIEPGEPVTLVPVPDEHDLHRASDDGMPPHPEDGD